MNEQEAIQLLEEMGEPNYKMCPYCHEILVTTLKKKSGETSYKCGTCKISFTITKCHGCKERKLKYKKGVCKDCYAKITAQQLEKIIKQENEKFKKLLLVTSPRKPNIICHINNETYQKISEYATSKKLTKSQTIKKAIQKLIVTDV